MTKSSQQAGKLFMALAVIIGVGYMFNNYNSSKGLTGEGLEQVSGALGVQGPMSDSGPHGKSTASAGGNEQPVESIQGRHPASQSTYSDTTLSSAELLPKGGLGASWSAVNPAGMGDLKGQNFLDAGYHTNTAIAGVSQTNKNASWDVRSEPNNPQATVGPFLNTTIEPNPFKRGLDA